MKDYKYRLRPGSRKEICPNCGRKSFTPYVDAEGEVLREDVGRCDHQQSCRYHKPPGEIRESASTPRHTRTNTIYQPPQPPSYIDPSDFNGSLRSYQNNSLMRFLHFFFDRFTGAETVNRVAMMMGVGTSRQFNGSPVFWLIDHHGNIRDGKIMGYDAKTGKRIKEVRGKPHPLFNNVHSLMKEKYQGSYKPCYFNAHALRYPGNINLPIWLFESEKAALIVSLALEWGGCRLGIPMASGGCDNFNPSDENKRNPFDRIQVLRGRKVVLFPDEGKYDDWRRKAMALTGFSSEVKVSTVMERNLHPYQIECEIEEGDALDDIILRYFEAGKDIATLLLTSYR